MHTVWHWVPGLQTLANYRKQWLVHDALAGLALSAVLVPVGMGYAQASGVDPIYGLYATIIPLLVYALFGPSRILVLGPDSTLAAVIAAVILPLSAGAPERAAPLAALLALLVGGFSLLIGLVRLGMLADLLSKPIRIGFLNAIAVTVLVGQTPKVLGFSVEAESLPNKVLEIVSKVLDGKVNTAALALGGGSLVTILVFKHWRPKWPTLLAAVAGTTLISWALGLHHTAGLQVLGVLPQGLPQLQLTSVTLQDAVALLPAALMVALLVFTDTSVLSRALALRSGDHVNPNQEIMALGMANIGPGYSRVFPLAPAPHAHQWRKRLAPKHKWPAWSVHWQLQHCWCGHPPCWQTCPSRCWARWSYQLASLSPTSVPWWRSTACAKWSAHCRS